MSLLALAVSLAAAPAETPPPRTNLPYVTSVSGPATVGKGETAVVKVEGSWPDPSWSLGRIHVRREGRRVVVALAGAARRDGFFPMVLVPFTATASLPVLPPGTWTVVAAGRNEDATCSLHVLSGH
ncbi:MAG: hypothetical protein FJY99_11350 [Candidatus Sericytochromatia bacterium]|nr:hypothetical protein [Candidatus Tanganyikabacteria bacterium]